MMIGDSLKYVSSLASRLFSPRASRRKRRPLARPRLMTESLERRDLLAASIFLDAGSSTVFINGTAAADDVLVWNDAGGRLYARISNPSETFQSSFAAGSVALVHFTGDDGNDTFRSTASVDSIAYGGAGNDLLSGGSGRDVLYGGDGDDILYGANGDDRLLGEAGNDTMMGNNGNDRLGGGDGDDTLYGGDGNDTMIGGAGNDRMYGEAGNDTMLGGRGNDTLNGGAGRNIMYGGVGNDILMGGGSRDQLWGEAGNDVLIGGGGDDFIHGGSGNDRLYGDEGDDALYGGDGDDELRGSVGQDRLFGGAGNDLLYGESGHDILVGDEGNDSLAGGQGNDVLIGGAGADSLSGQGGDDLLIGGTTAYDADKDRLQALALVWSSESPYDLRIERIEDETFAASLETEKTVFEDAVSDSLFGGDGRDWFIQTGVMGVWVPTHSHGGEDSSPPADDGHDHDHGEVILDHPPELEGFELVSSIDALTDRAENEALQTRLPHSDNPIFQREHLTLFELVRYDKVTHYASHSGAWSDPHTWNNGIVPTDGARVLIPMGLEVQVDGMVGARLNTIRVDGTLTFATTVNTELKVDTVIVSGSGAFIMGTEAAPIAAGVTSRMLITNDGPIDRAADPFGIGRGLISHGRVSIHGTEVLSFAALVDPEVEGAKILRLKSVPTGWKVGDTVVIAGTVGGTTQNEVRTISWISGSTLVLDRPLKYAHQSLQAGLDVHIANVTRNAVIESESSATDRRGHVMFMHNRDVHVAYAGFYKLGRSDKMVEVNDAVVNADWTVQAGTGANVRGRYAVHFHRNGLTNDGNPSVIMGSAVVDSPGWGFVNHSSYVDIIGNVAYNVDGAAFSTEAGDEIGSFRNNIAIGSRGSGQGINSRLNKQDFGHQGDGFWFQGGGVHVTGNVAAGNGGHAFNYYTRGLLESGGRREFLAANLPDPSIAKGAKYIAVGEVPIFEFANNVGYASSTGLAIRYHLLDSRQLGTQSVVRDSHFWNNKLGANMAYARAVEMRNMSFTNANNGQPDVGITGNLLMSDLTYTNVTVSGFRWGIVLPQAGYSVVNGGTFNNRADIIVQTAIAANRTVLVTGPIQFSNNIHVQMRKVVDARPEDVLAALESDVTTLNYGPYNHQRLYYNAQAADAVPFPSLLAGLPSQFVGLTNQQLWDRYGVALAGSVAPSNTFTVPTITGLIGL